MVLILQLQVWRWLQCVACIRGLCSWPASAVLPSPGCTVFIGCECMLQEKSSKAIAADVPGKKPKAKTARQRQELLVPRDSDLSAVRGTASSSAAATSTTEKALLQPAKHSVPVEAGAEDLMLKAAPTLQVCMHLFCVSVLCFNVS